MVGAIEGIFINLLIETLHRMGEPPRTAVITQQQLDESPGDVLKERIIAVGGVVCRESAMNDKFFAEQITVRETNESFCIGVLLIPSFEITMPKYMMRHWFKLE